VSKDRSRRPEPPYCWQNKEARRRIREMMNGHQSTSSLLSLYTAFTEEASNQGSETPTAGQPLPRRTFRSVGEDCAVARTTS
jgi:hypothetical protein